MCCAVVRRTATRSSRRSGDDSDGGFDLAEGTIYPALHRLERAGLIESSQDSASGRRRRTYALTARGRKEFAHPAPGLAALRRAYAGGDRVSATPIEDVLDELLLQSRADARSTRRLLDEASDHLHAAAAELEAGGMGRLDAEIEAVRRFGPVEPIAQAMPRRSFGALVFETLRAAIYLGGWGLVAVGVSGLVALVMNVWAGPSFVGAGTVFRGPGASVDEVAADAVVLRVIAGLVGMFVLLGYLVWRRHAGATSLLPPGLVDALGAAAFAAGTVGLAMASAAQAGQTGTRGVGFPLSGAVVALAATICFCTRAARALLRSGTVANQSFATSEPT